MFGYVKEIFTGLLSICTIVSFSRSLPSNYKEPIKCVSLNNRPYQNRGTLVDINLNETLFYPLIVNVNKCGYSLQHY